jgi:hypothetical protein
VAAVVEVAALEVKEVLVVAEVQAAQEMQTLELLLAV